MKRLRLLTVIALYLMTSIALAKASLHSQVESAEYHWHKMNGNTEYIFSLYSDSTYWSVSLFTVKPNELQEAQWHRKFSSFQNAQAFLLKYLEKDDLKNLERFKQENEQSLLSYTLSEEKDEVIWKAENQWSWEWELAYGKWLSENFHKDFYLENNISTDCADGGFAIRWIFSRIHKLPAANHLAGSNVLFSNESMKKEWKDLPINEDWRKDQRFLAALNFLLDNTYTHTLFRDSYPIAISKESFQAGTYMLNLSGESGHTRIVNFVSSDYSGKIPIREVSSTVPREIRSLYESAFWAEPVVLGESGILKYLWPLKVDGKWELVAEKNMPFYSLEQYDPNFAGVIKDVTLAIYDRVAPGFKPEKLITESLEQLEVKFTNRTDIVLKGYDYCQRNNCDEGTEGYEAWSTPSRDKGILSFISAIENITELLSGISPESKKIWQEGLQQRYVKVGSTNYNLKQLIYIFRYTFFSSNPYHNPEVRWGIESNWTAQAIIPKINELLMKRSERILSNLETHEIDNEIQRYQIGFIQYCQIFLPEQCDSLKLRLKESMFSAGPLVMNGYDWLERSLWFNSDPRVANDKKWGSLQSLAVPIHGLVNDQTIISKNKILFGGNRSERQVLDLNSRRTLPIPSGYSAEDLEKESGSVVLLSSDRKKLMVMDPNSFKLASLSFGDRAAEEVNWLSSDLLGIKISSTQMIVSKYKDGVFSMVTEITTQAQDINQFFFKRQFYGNKEGVENILILSLDANRYVIYDFSAESLKKVFLSEDFPPQFFSDNTVSVTQVSPRAYLVLARKNSRCDNPEDCVYDNTPFFSYRVNKTDGKVTQLPFEVKNEIGTNKFVIQKKLNANNEVVVATLDQLFEIQTSGPVLGNECYFVKGSNYFDVYKESESNLYRFDGYGNIQKVLVMKGSEYIFSRYKDHAVIQLNDGMAILDLKTLKYIFKTKHILNGDGIMNYSNSMYFAYDDTHSGLYSFKSQSNIPLMSGLSTFLATYGQCEIDVPIGAYKNFSVPQQWNQCYNDQNESDGVFIHLTGNKTYYLPEPKGD
ncbi:MAG: hypothetical protein AABY64_04585 [Bdellovibrionota bacterium]